MYINWLSKIRLNLGLLSALLLFFSWLPTLEAQEKNYPDLILYRGKISTMSSSSPQVEALAIKGRRIFACGTTAQIRKLAGPQTRLIDLQGRRVVPGFIESHGHLMGIGLRKLRLDLTSAKSPQEIARLVKARAARLSKGEWILGRGWDQNKWKVKKFPHHRWLTKAAPHNPVYLGRVDGHAARVNHQAMAVSGLLQYKSAISGGKIIRDGQGQPTGVLIDNAMSLVIRYLPGQTRKELRRAMLWAIESVLPSELPLFTTPGWGGTIRLYRQLIQEKKLNLRIYAMLSANDSTLNRYFQKGPQIGLGENRLTIRAVKLMADGALGSRGAALLEDYQDKEATVACS